MTKDYKMVKFGDVAKKVNITVDRETTTLEKYIAGDHMNTDDLRIKEWGVIGDDYLGPAFNKMFKAGQILYGSRRTYLRKVAIPHFDGICANTTFVLEPTGKGLLPELVPFVMQSQAFTDHSIRESKGSTNPYVNWKDIAKYEFPVPTKTERQTEIVRVLCEVEYYLIKNIQFLSLAENYKKNMMNKLFHTGFCNTVFKETAKLGTVPKDYNIKTVNEIADVRGRIGWKGLKSSEYTGDGPFLIAHNHVDKGKIKWESCDHLSEYRYDESPEIKLCNDDIIMSKDGVHLGKVALIKNLPNKATINSTMMLIRIKDENVNPTYLYHFLSSPIFKKYLAMNTTGSAIPHLYQETMKKLKVLVPQIKEQEKISTLLTKIDEIIYSGCADLDSIRALKFRLINEYFPSKGEVEV